MRWNCLIGILVINMLLCSCNDLRKESTRNNICSLDSLEYTFVEEFYLHSFKPINDSTGIILIKRIYGSELDTIYISSIINASIFKACEFNCFMKINDIPILMDKGSGDEIQQDTSEVMGYLIDDLKYVIEGEFYKKIGPTILHHPYLLEIIISKNDSVISNEEN